MIVKKKHWWVLDIHIHIHRIPWSEIDEAKVDGLISGPPCPLVSTIEDQGLHPHGDAAQDTTQHCLTRQAMQGHGGFNRYRVFRRARSWAMCNTRYATG